jgi:mannose/fructose/N-acetylgalactosamine-specific phosphotransferase system component IIC
MLEVPNALAGAVTVVALVGGGIFLYPWLLTRRGGAIAMAAITAALAGLFFYFDRGSGNAAASAALALLWAAAPAAVGVIVFRLQRR